MMYKIVATSRFKKDLKTVLKRGYDVSLLESIVSTLAKGKELREEHKGHPLRGRWKGFRECPLSFGGRGPGRRGKAFPGPHKKQSWPVGG
jgi:mRNA interferase YafQ